MTVSTPLRTLLLAVSLLLAAPGSGVAGLPFLKADGPRIVDEAGREVALRGVNLGGWLVEEMWMLPFETRPPANTAFKVIESHVTLWSTVEERFGRAGMLQLRTAWRDAWLSKADFERIKAADLNCVRLPFLFDSLEEPDGVFPWIDRALAWARELNLYVILDLHGAPGRQSREHHTGQAGVNKLFKDPAMVRKTAEVWRRIAERYKDHSEVAGYDLLNEPTGAPTDATLYLVQDRLYRAVRAVDVRHIVIIEDGYKGIEQMPEPALADWQNVILSPHFYNFSAKSEADHGKSLDAFVASVIRERDQRKVPVYIGEFNIEPHATQGMMTHFVETFDKNGLSWSLWTYKSAMRNGGGGMWSWFRSSNSIQPLDPFHDSVAELLKKTEQVRTEKLEETPTGEALRTNSSGVRVAMP